MAALGDVPDANDEDDEDGANVCDIEFSLAFGGKILLHNTKLRLGRGRRYGIMGKNGAGKTTLLTNIGSGNIEGMPPHLKMVYVQHDDRSEDGGVCSTVSPPHYLPCSIYIINTPLRHTLSLFSQSALTTLL